jgi:hypothetical protein
MADMETTYNGGGVQTTTRAPSNYAPAQDNDFFRRMITRMRRPEPQAGMGGAHTAPLAASGPDLGAGQSGVIRRAPERRFNTAPLMNMDTMGGDLQKTAMQRMTDRSNRMNAMIGIPSGDTQQGSHNAGHASFLPAEAEAQQAAQANAAGLARGSNMTAGERTAAARRQLIEMYRPPQR